MSRISTKNAHIIREGIKVGKRMVTANRAGMSSYMSFPSEKLAHDACMRIVTAELDRIAKNIILHTERMRNL